MGERDQERIDDEATGPASEGGDPAQQAAEPDASSAETVDAAAADGQPEIIEPDVVQLDPHVQLRADLEAAQARLRTVSKAYTDLQKEMTSFRERMENQGRVKVERQAFEAVSAVLEPVQNLKRSMSASGDAESLRQGLHMVHHQFMEALRKLGLEEVAGQGSTFNPTYHEALSMVPVTDPEQDGVVLEVYRDGYTVNGRVLQAAQVIVGKYQAPAEA